MPYELKALIGILAALTAGVISPGPSFIMVARTAVSASRSQGLWAALGMGVGGCVYGAAALLGLQGLFHAVPSLYIALKFLGGLYLCYLGFLALKSARQPLTVTDTEAMNGGRMRAFGLGLMTQISNPKTAIIYASVFAAFLPATFSIGFAMVLLLLVFLVESCWYSVVALVLSSEAPQRVYLSYKSWIDRAAGVVLIGLGLRLVASAARP